jgi:tight adherence protein B
MNAAEIVVALAAAGTIAALASAWLPRPTRPPLVTSPARRAMADDSVAAFEHAARDVRAGLSTRTALADSLRRHPGVLPGLRARLEADEPLAEAVHDLAATGDDELFVHALRVSLRTDAHPADVLDRAVLIVRERAAWRHERHSQAAQARLSARLLTLLPVGFALWSTATSARVRDAELHQPVVAVCLVLGLVLNLFGWWWMRHLVRGGDP